MRSTGCDVSDREASHVEASQVEAGHDEGRASEGRTGEGRAGEGPKASYSLAAVTAAMRSAIITVGRCVLARGATGITEASHTTTPV